MAFGARRAIFLGLVLVMVLGIAVYFRLWAIDSRFSSDDRELIRRQFDLANMDAMDESAEWRRKYDDEVERATTCLKEMLEMKATLEKKMEETANANPKLAMLQKENIGLLERVESLQQELEAEKLKCSLRQLR
ncbi:uncharacterized protein LOC122058434 [Macadamia integrifolia]|uniref:uncharacterized protein LOC122058434 n=1 Tax=Macadamia integrifolia TaxID=60698 RepID=UPI001C53180B|nr:uncharacterized protein LOC122058434 [Macadamia integrifolia]